MDSVVGAMAAEHGVEVVYASLDEGLDLLRGREFDCVVLSHFLHLISNPEDLLKRCARLLTKEGTIVMSGPNFDYLPALIRKYLGWRRGNLFDGFAQSGVNVFTVKQLESWLRGIALRPETIAWRNPEVNGAISGSIPRSRWYRSALVQGWEWLKHRTVQATADSSSNNRAATGRSALARWMSEDWIITARRSAIL
jgi:SAM-dependent methyltransferase